MLKLNNISKKFGSKKVLENLNFEFSKGKVYGIVGENGAGKTTLFRCIAELEDFEGNINAEYLPIKDHIGYLPTDLPFLAYITGEEYISFVLHARGIKNIDIPQKNIFNLPLQQYISDYSTGMKKKLALTAVLLLDAEYYILDEPFNGVDIQSSWSIQQIIQFLKAKGKVVILSSHIFSTLKDSCDEILVLENKHIQAQYLPEKFQELEDQMSQKYTLNNLTTFFE